jgi:hypothetical protein
MKKAREKGIPEDVERERERVEPFLRMVAFCKTFNPRQRSEDTGNEVPLLEEVEFLAWWLWFPLFGPFIIFFVLFFSPSQATLLRLVMQHMAFLGFSRSLVSLVTEANVPYWVRTPKDKEK